MAQRKYIIISESWLDIDFRDGKADNSRPGCLLLNVARRVARRDSNSLLITEIGNDRIGDTIEASLLADGVDTSCVGRYYGLTSLMVNVDGAVSRYDVPAPGERFDVKWPRIEKEDVVVFGGYMAVNEEVRERLQSLLTYAADRKATIVYLPDVEDLRIPRITMVMPRVFENLEMAQAVITVPGDLAKLYGHEDSASAFRNNLSFYTDNVAAITGQPGNLRVDTFGNLPGGEGEDVVSAVADVLLNIPEYQ